MYTCTPPTAARINLGIRRRLAPLMENDRDRIKLMNSLLLSMPGSPVLYYGDEIGMGDNIFLGDRDGVRTPMQWTRDRNGGFSRADPQRLYLPPIQDPIYGLRGHQRRGAGARSVVAAELDRRLLAVRKNYAAFGRGRFTLAAPGQPQGAGLSARVRRRRDPALRGQRQPRRRSRSNSTWRLQGPRAGRDDGDAPAFPPIWHELPYLLTLPAYGFFWFRLATDGTSSVAGTEQYRGVLW
jgi:maltose alpha-D-glucosyltransferase/alpha-amylase